MSRSQKRQRITYIHQHFRPPTENGGGRPYEFARRLAAEGHKVTMIAAGDSLHRYQIDGFTVEEVPIQYSNSMSMPRRIMSFLNFMIRASWVAARQPADVVLASSTPLTVVVPGLIAAKLRRAKFVVEIRDLWPSVPMELGFLPAWMAPPSRALEVMAYATADEVIALSPRMAEGVRAVRPTCSVSIIPNASDMGKRDVPNPSALRAQLGASEDTLLFVYAGSLGVIYDPLWLAQLAIAFKNSEARLVVVGDGKGRESAMEVVRASGMDPSKVFIGSRSRQEALDLVSVADVAVSSLIDHEALHGSSLNKAFDALGLSKPMIFNHGGWLCHLITEHSAGWRWSRALDPEEVTARLAALSPELLAETGAAAARLGEEHFDRERLFTEFAHVLLRASDGSRR